MRTALIGVPFSGKSTVFQALTGPYVGKKEETIGTIKVPDSRIDCLKSIYNPKKTTFAEFVVSDINIAEGKDSVIGAKTKNLIQKTELLVFVLRNFPSFASSAPIDPKNEYEKIKEDIIITDLIIVEKKLEREKREQRKTPDIDIMRRLQAVFEDSRLPREDEFSEDEIQLVSNFSFLSLKKRIVLINQEEGATEIPEDLATCLQADSIDFFSISATLECELNQLPIDEQRSFLDSYGLTETAKDRFVREMYNSLGLISFLTAGEDECRAWPIRRGMTAVAAASKIHSDIARGFIRAETISFAQFKELGSEAACKKAGVYRLEGKGYVVEDGDIMNFRFNV